MEIASELLKTLTIIICTFFLPALAIFPSWIKEKELWIALPFLSGLIVIIFVSLMKSLGIYSPETTRSFIFFCTAIFLLRFWKLKPSVSKDHYIQQSFSTLIAVVISMAIAFSIMVELGMRGFSIDDEIYSWNMWAIEHFLSQEVMFYYTKAPYPQFFPKVLSFSYMLLGDYSFQGPVKASLALFPIIILFIWSRTFSFNNFRSVIFFVFSTLVFLELLKLERIFMLGMPDTMASSAILASAYFLLRQTERRKTYLLVSSLLACVSCLIKQPGLLWASFSFPLMVFWLHRKSLNKLHILAGGLPIIFSLVWAFTEGNLFYANSGVISRSIGERDSIKLVGFIFEKWIVAEPAFSATILLSFLAIFCKRTFSAPLLLFVLPSMALWLVFANYDLRAGTPALCFLPFLLLRSLEYKDFLQRNRGQVFAMVCLLVSIGVFDGVRKGLDYYNKIIGFEVGKSVPNNFRRVFENAGDDLYKELVTKKLPVWTTSNYSYGIFYGQTKVFRPTYDSKIYQSKTVLREILDNEIRYVVTSPLVPIGPGHKEFEKLASQCPDMFRKKWAITERYKFEFFEVLKNNGRENKCRLD